DRSDLSIRQSSTGELLENVDVTHSVLPGDLVIIGIGFF
ncbi:MAG TPA: capsular biosynthesis protein, partial [Leclercia adecarboxylata]|nr:capsular biosynthesis protein [Leclercia adecarboxylata]